MDTVLSSSVAKHPQGEPHYKLRRLSIVHPLGDSTPHNEETDEPVTESTQGSLVWPTFMVFRQSHMNFANSFMSKRPPDDEPATKYGAAVQDTLQTVEILRLKLLSMQDTLSSLEVVGLANDCKQTIDQLCGVVTDPILFDGLFAKYYLKFLKELQNDQESAADNVRYALGAGIPGIMRTCEEERRRVTSARKVLRGAVDTLETFLRDHQDADERTVSAHPFILRNIRTLRQILAKFDQMEDFCRYYEEYYGYGQYRHLHGLLHHFEGGSFSLPPRQENNAMIDLWTEHDRFTLHFAAELDCVIQFFQSGSGRYRVQSVESMPSTESLQSLYSEELRDQTYWRGIGRHWKMGRLKITRQPRQIKCLISGCYHRLQSWLGGGN